MLSRFLLFVLFALLVAGGGVAGGSLGGPDPISPDRAEATTTIVRWGPFTTPAFGQYQCYPIPLQGSPACPALTKPCTDCYITGIVPSLVYWSGNPGDPSSPANYQNGPMLHHFVLWNDARTDATCPATGAGIFGDRFAASGNERTIMSLPSPYGYYVAATKPAGGPANWYLNVHLHNHSNPSPSTVYVEVEFTHQPSSANLKDTTGVWLDEDNCDDSRYNVCMPGACTTTTPPDEYSVCVPMRLPSQSAR